MRAHTDQFTLVARPLRRIRWIELHLALLCDDVASTAIRDDAAGRNVVRRPYLRCRD